MLTTLTYLSLAKNCINETNDVIDRLGKQNKTLEHLILHSNQIDKSVIGLAQNQTLRYLDLRFNTITIENANYFKENITLTTLRLNNNEFDGDVYFKEFSHWHQKSQTAGHISNETLSEAPNSQKKKQ